MSYLNTSQKLIVREGPRLSGMVDTNHLSTYAQINPIMFDDMIHMAFTSKQIAVDPINELTFGSNRVKILDGEAETWNWKQAIRPRPAKITENLESSNSFPGIDGTFFKIKLDQDWFSPGDVLTPDHINFVRIVPQGTPYYESGGFVYLVELMTRDPQDFYPTALLKVDVEYIPKFNLHGEQASLAGDLKFDNIITLQDTLGDMMRLQHKVTGYVEDMTLRFDMVEWDNETNKPTKLLDRKWIGRAEVKFWKYMDMMKGNYLFYGVGANNLTGEKGYKVKSNYGIKYQLENWGNVESYNTFSEKLLREYLMDIYIGRLPEGQRNVTLMTGEVGMMYFDQAFKNEANKFLIQGDTVLKGNDPMNLSFGYQIKEYRMINGGVVRLVKLPYLDVDITNVMRDTNTGHVKQSANFYVMDFSGDNSQNLWVVKRDNSLKYGYQIGTSAPWGVNGQQVISVLEDAYTLIARDRCSPWIKDVTATGCLKYKPL